MNKALGQRPHDKARRQTERRIVLCTEEIKTANMFILRTGSYTEQCHEYSCIPPSQMAALPGGYVKCHIAFAVMLLDDDDDDDDPKRARILCSLCWSFMLTSETPDNTLIRSPRK